MQRVLEAGCVLLLLAVFLSYLLAPALEVVQRRVRTGRRRRPLSRPLALALLFPLLLVTGGLGWRAAAPGIRQWTSTTAPAAVNRVFSRDQGLAAVDRMYARAPLSPAVKRRATRATTWFFQYVEDVVRAALGDLANAAPYVRWLGVTPVVAFLLLAYAPGFRRSALRVLPHGHLSWRGEEYLRDVNSALAGYVRAQLAAGLIIAGLCTIGFWVFGLPDAVSMGVVAGLLELVPVIGPLTVVVMAAGQAGSAAPAVIVFLVALRGVQDYVVYPRLIRQGMHLSSIAVILAVWAGAALNGATGVLLAIPAAGFLSVSLRHWREYRAIERLVRAHGRTDES